MEAAETQPQSPEGQAQSPAAAPKPVAQPSPKPSEPAPKQDQTKAAKPVPSKPRPPQGKPQSQKPQQQTTQETPKDEKPKQTACMRAGLKLFNRWDMTEVRVNDPGLRNYISLNCMPVPRTGGKYGSGHFQKNKMSVVERFMNKLMVNGHRGKKHKLTSRGHTGQANTLYKIMKESFIIIEKKTKKHPVQVMVTAIENSGPLEEVASYRLGGIIARNSVVTSPQRRLDLALRHLTQGIYRTTFKNRKSLAQVISEELIIAANNDNKSFAVSERNRMEKEAEGAR